jgi:probable HAF family extracellular repeat protein
MKSKSFLCIASLAVALAISVSAQTQVPNDNHSRYRVVLLSGLGGASSSGNTINNRGLVMGNSDLAGDVTTHATLWRHGVPNDLGTLGGPSSSIAWPVKNDKGVISGISEMADLDTYGENWSCWVFFPAPLPSGHVCRGFVWQNNVMTALPTLGGTHGYAAGMNNWGQIVGWAETTTPDSTCVSPQIFQFLPVIYGPGLGDIQPLPTLYGDPDGAATAINDRGQAIGISGICDQAVGRATAAHMVFWDHGKAIEIPGLGGVQWNTPVSLNNRGAVVGFANVTDSPRIYHAFLWTREKGTADLGTLPGDIKSQALGINNQGQMVGFSKGATIRAVVWKNGVPVDLNALVPPSSLTLVFANDVNDRGEIAGEAFDPVTGETPAFLAIPTDD